jgi:putative Mg2+ transporter-C (MgtC) family protein
MFHMEPLTAGDVALRVVLAVALGGVIGLERGARNHPAGFRTHILVCVGACLAILTNEFVFDAVGAAGTDPTRIGAQVISGIGFLGVGTIFMSGRNTVKGLTTAAGLWASGAIGLAVGVGFYFAAVVSAAVVVLVLAVFPPIENTIYRTSRRMRLHAETDTIEAEKALTAYIKDSGNCIKSKHISTISNVEHRVSSYFTIQLKSGACADTFVEELAALPGVKLVEVQ